MPIAPGGFVDFVDVGARVEVDLLDEDVQITWRVHHALREVGSQDYARLKRGSAAMRFSSEVDEAMLDAMQRVLTAAGYVVTRRSQGYGTFHLSVTERPTGPSWRDWHDQQFRRRSAIQHRLLTMHQKPGDR
ncbi:hypothetical protein QLQ12_27455 [Actinoplanes sp. NEAU-A12]|uniref:Uncharacterized protein n=1 Tax=Actinoplanes sandaracinus TaxID=3045177 RepID=A0ABT6WRJ4_9ACTN|nr:hypothetical protein [Actinoplanes sandaracinus]MDI6102361.1 hypothetical protein [Actinoplanes sandaracinus]